jgi:hypothetical protein
MIYSTIAGSKTGGAIANNTIETIKVTATRFIEAFYTDDYDIHLTNKDLIEFSQAF